jgi:methyl acetate hydrolase
MAFDGSAIDRLLTGAVDNGTYEGVVATVVDRDGVLHEGSAGTASLDTMFRNASMTKAVATTAALQLLEQGQIALDQPVEEILPEFAKLQVLEPDGSLRPPASKATIRQLMTHTAGLGYFFLNEGLLTYCGANGLPNSLSGEKTSLSAPLVNDPARSGSTASTPTGSVWSSRRSASRALAPT